VGVSREEGGDWRASSGGDGFGVGTEPAELGAGVGEGASCADEVREVGGEAGGPMEEGVCETGHV